jgi:glycosyltransferase involved in cell wall biosynthesis
MVSMRFIYADPGLVNEAGHHANACRFISAELRRRGIEPEVLAFKELTAALQQSLSAQPFFRAHTYWSTDGDPICGWLSNFHRCSDLTMEDLLRHAPLEPSDMVYVNSAQPSQLMGIAQWMRRLPDERLPHVVLEFGSDPRVEIRDGPKGMTLSIPDPRSEAAPILYRFAALCIQQRTASRLHLATFDPFCSQVYSILLGRPMGVLPLLQHASSRLRLRSGEGGITVAVMGHQRGAKGYELMPKIAELLLQGHPTVRLLVHNSEAARAEEANGEILRLASREPRLRVDERAVNLEEWLKLLGEADVVLCPYLPEAFRASYSALAAEAIANGIPLVVPANTTLANLSQEFGVGEQFEKYEPQSVAEAVLRVVRDFDSHARRSLAAAEKWPSRYGPKHTVDAILAVGQA